MTDRTLTLLDRVQRIENQLDSISDQYRDGSKVFLGQITTTGSAPDVARAVYAINPVIVSGPIGEGQVPTLTPLSTVVFAANLGTQTAQTGAYVIVVQKSGRASFIFNG